LEIRASCNAPIHFTKDLYDVWYGKDVETTHDPSFVATTLENWELVEFQLHKAPPIAAHPGYETEHGYDVIPSHVASEEHLEREYSTETLFTRSKREPSGDIRLDDYDGPAIDLTQHTYELSWVDGELWLLAYTSRDFPGLCAYETERRKEQADDGQMAVGPFMAKKQWEMHQEGHRDRLRQKRDRRKVISLLRELELDPLDAKVTARVRELGYDQTIRNLYSLRRKRAAGIL